MRYVKSKPSEYLVVGSHGRITSLGLAGSAFLWPGSSSVTVPSTKQEAVFALTQETRDGIPLRFKGIVVYHVESPGKAASLFDFANGDGVTQINDMIGHVCMGELRETVSHMTMKECIEQRKTTLTESIVSALTHVIRGSQAKGDGDTGEGWGISLDVVQVAQVFIVDDELRRELEAETRNKIRAESELSGIHTRGEIELAKLDSERTIKKEEMASERLKNELALERIHLVQGLERERVEAESPVKILAIERNRELLEKELEMRKLGIEVERCRVEEQMLLDAAKQDLRKEMLPIEQLTSVAESVSHMFQGANLSIYGSDSTVLGKMEQVVDLLVAGVRKAVSAREG